MSTLPEEVDCHLKPLSRLSGNEHLRLGTRGTARPTGAWLHPWLAVAREAIVVDFVRSLAPERVVWSMFIAPLNDRDQLVTKQFATKRNQRQLGSGLEKSRCGAKLAGPGHQVLFIRGDPNPRQRKRADDFVVVKSQSRTEMPRMYSRLFGEYAARASFALVTLGHYPLDVYQKSSVMNDIGLFSCPHR